jgi:folate-binding protein YgfZ
MVRHGHTARVEDVARDYLTLRDQVGAAVLARDVITASGPEASTFLQGQLSQDVVALTPGSSAWSLLLQPQGKVDAWLRVTRPADVEDTLVLDVEASYGAAVVARLERFKLRTRCELALTETTWIAVRGPAAGAPEHGGLPTGWAAGGGYDLLGADLPPGIPQCAAAAFERLRIEAGAPRMGAELTERTIPAEAGIVAQSVSFTKGCYTGQELVARIDSRGGNVPKVLRGIRLDGTGDTPPVGADLVVDGKVVGELTSVAPAADGLPAVALAYAGRAVTPPATAEVRWADASAPAAILVLPMLAAQ